MPGYQRPRRQNIETWNGDIQNLPCIGNGVSGLVFRIDQDRVAKVPVGTPKSFEDIETERKIYRRFEQNLRSSNCNNILTCLELDNPRGLVFEFCEQTVRSRLRSVQIPSATLVKWALQAAHGLAKIHECGVIQGDVGCHNMLLDAKDTLKYADFAGSSLDGSEATVNYEVRSRLPGITSPTKRSDVFALGSTLFEMFTGSAPYSSESYSDVLRFYKIKSFPDVSKLPLGDVITKCWKGQFDTATRVAQALEAAASPTLKCSLQQKGFLLPDSGIPTSEMPDISQLAITRSRPRRDQRISESYVHQTSPRPWNPMDHGAEKGKKRSGRRSSQHNSLLYKFMFPHWVPSRHRHSRHEKEYYSR